jgi:hypothetical protein
VRVATVVLIALATAVAGCGAESEVASTVATSSTTQVTGVGSIRAGSVAQLAQCSDWNAGTRAERLATIADIRAQVNQAGADGPTPNLTDGAAYSLFQRACANSYALGFRLYKLYLRAASFGALSG